MRSGPLLFSRWPTGAGWGWRRREPGDRDLSGEPRRLWPPYVSFPLLLSPRASAAAAFYFHSTLGGGGGAGAPQRGRRVSGVLGLVSLVQRPVAGEGPAGIQGSGILLAHTPNHFCTLAFRDARSKSLNVSFWTLSWGILPSCRHTHSETHVHRCLPLLIQPTFSTAHTDTHIFLHTG